MRLPKSIAYLSTIAVCAFAAYSAHAQTVQTNIATFTATMDVQQPGTSGPGFEAASYKPLVLNTGGLIAELSSAIHTNFSKAAKLAVVSGNDAQFEVIDGTNTVAISTNIITIFPTTGNQVFTGKLTSNLLTEKMLMIFEMDFNDVSLGASDLQFSLRGVGSISMTETSNLTSQSAKMTLVGDGKLASTNIIVTATLSGAGKE